MENVQLSLEVHYQFYNDGIHEMDARAFNYCELQLLKAIEELNKYCEVSKLEVGIKERQEGSLIETILVTVKSIEDSKLFSCILSAFVGYFFNKRKSKLEDIEKRIDILQKIKAGNLTEEEAETLVGKDKILQKLISSYYKKLQDQEEIRQVSVIGCRHDEKREVFAQAAIQSSDFNDHIVDESETTQNYIGTTIGICSPVLIPGHGKKWKGIFNGHSIEFVIEDHDFLKQVFHNDFKFGATTTIKCDLAEKVKPMGEPSYTVTNVEEVNDNEHFQRSTKMYRKKQADLRQLELFSNDDF